MTAMLAPSLHSLISRCSAIPASQSIGRILAAVAIATSFCTTPAFAKDPFRTSNPRPIGDNTEAVFRAIFEKGDYKTADLTLSKVETNEPLAHALQASMAYVNWQDERDAQKRSFFAEEFRKNAEETRETAKQLMASDPLRGNVYVAVGHFLDAAHVVGTQGTVRGTPQALSLLQEAFKHLDAADKISPQDPELNVIKGYMDLFLSINLPFSNPNDAIARLERYAGPRYLADRGLAIGYRDMNQQAKALDAVNRALQITPTNPELLYLKAQILVRQGNNRDSIPLFEQALAKQEQLPQGLVKQISKELEKSKRRLANVGK
jgi:tetratricopeptide (TPR) repeat protein